MTVNATDLFERYLYDAEFDDVMDDEGGAAGSIPNLEVTEISFGQSINCPLTNRDNVVVSGSVSTVNGNGNGSVAAAWRRVCSSWNWFELDAGIGNGPRAGGRYFHELTNKTSVDMSGSMQFTGRGLLPAFSLSLGHRLGPNCIGYLTYSTDWRLYSTNDEIVLREEHSGMSTMVVYNTASLRFQASLQFGIPQTFAFLSVTKKFQDPGESQVRGTVK